uniref:Uncharacterized protein n=1 Tax=Parascaris equorum TaxID=6256 RepID=A0A914R713_PAREQ
MESASQNGLVTSQGDSRPAYNEMTSRDYYFDSYAHFGIHELVLFVHPEPASIHPEYSWVKLYWNLGYDWV